MSVTLNSSRPRSGSGSVTVVAAHRGGLQARTIKVWVRHAVRTLGLPSGGITVAFVERRVSRWLNRRYRGRDRATNVLSFRYRPAIDSVIGELVLCPEVIREEVPRPQFRNRIRFLLEHGCIHLTGREHGSKKEVQQWRRLELKLRK